jgi:phospholipase D1/2
LRRAVDDDNKWRLDELLQRKAAEGVKIYIIIYQNVGMAVPIDSRYTKYSLLDAHPNVFVQRSPKHVRGLKENVFFWTHHEKILSIDHTIGFVGGLDLCYGRYDTPEHILVDDKQRARPGEYVDDPQIWPGKDYSNPRVKDFYDLDKPLVDIFDRKTTPRMPWHDVSMQVAGQPARDIARHFIQRWNFLIRIKPPLKVTPKLLPPPDFTPMELEQLDLTGTCEFQLLRSAGPWSMGFQGITESSILTAYIRCIEQSKHFIFIENQFFITSCEIDGTTIENGIGDAIVKRVLRAHKEATEWRAVLIIPLIPGFSSSIDNPEAASLRLIMFAQWMSLSQGNTSIFARLRRHGIEPEDYISVYGLRGWAQIGDEDRLVTEQVYIHSKIMIVDDRVAIIGSANINERSMKGSRDSEVAAIIRDTAQEEITMAGKPFMAGRFAHTLRMRLQAEHLGLNVDDLEQRYRMMDGVDTHHSLPKEQPQSFNNFDHRDFVQEKKSAKLKKAYFKVGVRAQSHTPPSPASRASTESQISLPDLKDLSSRLPEETSPASSLRKLSAPFGRPKVTTTGNPLTFGLPPNMSPRSGLSPVTAQFPAAKRGPDITSRTMKRDPGTPPVIPSSPVPTIPTAVHHGDGGSPLPLPKLSRITGHPLPNAGFACLADPLDETFFYDQWNAIAEHNTEVYRRVFHTQPDNNVLSWAQYKAWEGYAKDNHNIADIRRSGRKSKLGREIQTSGPVGANATGLQKAITKSLSEETASDTATTTSGEKDPATEDPPEGFERPKSPLTTAARRRKGKHSKMHEYPALSKEEMMRLLREVQGHLVMWPTEWFAKEVAYENFLYNLDKYTPRALGADL